MKKKLISIFIVTLTFFLCSCANFNNETRSVYKKKLPGIYSWYLNAKHLILACKHFRFKFNKQINYDSSEIELFGYFTANTYLNFIEKDRPTFLKKIDINIKFLGSDRAGVIHSEWITIEYDNGDYPSIFGNIPFSIILPYNPEYVFVSLQYSADVYYTPIGKDIIANR